MIGTSVAPSGNLSFAGCQFLYQYSMEAPWNIVFEPTCISYYQSAVRISEETC